MRRAVLPGTIALVLLGGIAAVVTMQGPAQDRAPGEPAGAALRSELSAEFIRSASAQSSDQPVQPQASEKPALENGVIPGASPDGQTAPAKFSEKNAEADRVPIMARPLPLTDEQRQEIYARLMESGQKAEANIQAEPATILPSTVVLHELPQGLVEEAPALRGYKYVKLEDRLVIVNPPDRVVVGEIRRDAQ